MADFDLLSPAELMVVRSEALNKFTQLFKKLFYPKVMTFKSKKVFLDEIPGQPAMAVYCAPRVSGQVDKTRGHLTNAFEPGYVKSKHTVDLQASLDRVAGEKPMGELSPAERFDYYTLRNLEDEEQSIQQLEEYQCVQMALYGKYTMTGPNLPEPIEVDTGRNPENHIVQAGAGRWSQQDPDTYDPTHDIDAYADNSTGTVDILVMGSKAWQALNRFKLFREKFDSKRGSASLAELGLKDLGLWVSIKGYYGDVMIMVTKNKYIDPVDKKTKRLYMPENGLLLASLGIQGYMMYGVIQNTKAVKAGMEEGERFLSQWEEGGDPADIYTMTECSPAAVQPETNHFVFVEVN
jgi:hypothetical protein